jgi:hypothetical protein
MRPQESSVFRRLVSVIGFLAGLAPAVFAGVAQAQVDIDQGKSPAEMFSSDCATCHKSVRGLASGKNSLMLSSFLREHYTASRQEASSLAAYVLGAGGGEAAPKGQEPKEPKTAARPGAASARAEEPPASTKPQRPAAIEAKHEEPTNSPSGPTPEQPATASVSPQMQPAPVAPAVTAPAANPAPAAVEAPGVEFSPTTSAAGPAESQSGDSAPVPRDNIPD